MNSITNDPQLADNYLEYTLHSEDIHQFMRPADVNIFRTYSQEKGLFILVRRTNPLSIQYIGKPGFVPKPLKCKPKTAKSNACFIRPDGEKISSKCGGLVVNPRILKWYAFNNDKREWVKAKNTWDKHWKQIPNGFDVQMNKNSPYYGCVLRVLSKPSPTQKNTSDPPPGCAYIHGDYDLYALIHKTRMSIRESQQGFFEGVSHTHSADWEDFSSHANRAMKVPMIQHGSQEHFSDHSDETVDIFAPFPENYLQIRKVCGRLGLIRLYHEFFHRYCHNELLFIAHEHGLIECITFK